MSGPLLRARALTPQGPRPQHGRRAHHHLERAASHPRGELERSPRHRVIDERGRILAIAQTVSRSLENDVDVVCLQEVSGDQLAALRTHVGPSVAILHHRLARSPRLRGEGVAELADPSEHLVVLARDGSYARVRGGHTFENDPGKGMLVVEVRGRFVVVCTHVRHGERSSRALPPMAPTTNVLPSSRATSMPRRR